MKAAPKKTKYFVLGQPQKAHKHVLIVGNARDKSHLGILIGTVSGERTPLDIISPSSGDTVDTVFHVLGTSDGSAINATITSLDADMVVINGTPADQTGTIYDFQFDASSHHSADYSVSVSNGDGLDSIHVQ
jgi:hypothetical protein